MRMFKELFNSKRSIAHNMNSIIESHTGLLVREYFHQRIREEKRRTDRTNIPFSLLFIDLSFVRTHDMRERIDEETLVGITLDVIDANSRETDLKGWFDDERMGILMPSTSCSGAATLCNKLTDLMKGRLSRYMHNDFQLEDYVSIISYPEIFGEGDDLQERLFTKGKKKDSSEYIYKNNKTLKLKEYFEKLVLFSDGHRSVYATHRHKVVKRCIDLIGSLLGITLCVPIFLIVALAIKLTSPGPVLFKQKRVGLNGRVFTFLKFRSMHTNCDQNIHKKHVNKLSRGEVSLFQDNQNGVLSYKLQNDPRITKIGWLLRVTSLDEIPQLFNVLKGDMSLVGPRPYPVYQVEHCRLWQHSRHMIKPGITGLAQLRARYNITYTDAYRLDLHYLKKWSLWLDLKILIETVPFALSGRGAV